MKKCEMMRGVIFTDDQVTARNNSPELSAPESTKTPRRNNGSAVTMARGITVPTGQKTEEKMYSLLKVPSPSFACLHGGHMVSLRGGGGKTNVPQSSITTFSAFLLLMNFFIIMQLQAVIATAWPISATQGQQRFLCF